MGFEPATSAKGAEWVQEALCRGSFTKVSGAVPRDFEACVAVRHPALHTVLTAENRNRFYGGRDPARPIPWSEVASATVPVINGHTHRVVDGKFWSRPTQYRRLDSGSWIVEEIQQEDWVSLARVGDSFIHGPDEGSLEPEQALLLMKLLHDATTTPESCWFGFWEGYGAFSSEKPHYFLAIPPEGTSIFSKPSWRRIFGEQNFVVSQKPLPGPSIATRQRRWVLYRAPLVQFEECLPPCRDFNPVDLVWPDDRSWFLATDTDAECTLVAGNRELLAVIRNESGLETQLVQPEDRLPWLGDVLQPVVEKPPNLSLPPAFESRKRTQSHDHLLREHSRLMRPRLWERVLQRIGFWFFMRSKLRAARRRRK